MNNPLADLFSQAYNQPTPTPISPPLGTGNLGLGQGPTLLPPPKPLIQTPPLPPPASPTDWNSLLASIGVANAQALTRRQFLGSAAAIKKAQDAAAKKSGKGKGASPTAVGASTFPTPQQFGLGQVTYPQVPYLTANTVEQPKFAFDTGNENSILQQLQGLDLGLGSHLPGALQWAAGAYKPEINDLMNQYLQGANTITKFNQGTQAALGDLSKKVGGYYDNAIGLQGRISNAIGASLKSQNPNAQDQLALQQNGAPAAQQQQIADANQAGYGLGGSVLAGIGNLGASGLAAQKASEQSYAAQIPALLATQGSQALASLGGSTQTALAKILAGEAPLALSLAKGEQTGNIAQAAGLRSLFNTLSSADLKKMGFSVDIAKANATQAGLTTRANASNQLASDRVVNSQTANRIAAYRAGVYAWHLQNPTAATSASGLSTLTDDLRKWHDGTGSVTTTTGSSASGGKTSSTSVSKTTNALNYSQAVNAIHDKYPSWTAQQVYDFANTAYDKFGDGGRPLDLPMQQALQAAGLPTNYEHGFINVKGKAKPVGVYYLTQKQYLALTQQGIAPPAQENDQGTHWIIGRS